MSRNAMAIPRLTRESTRRVLFQPIANQCTPYAVNASAAM